MIDDICCLTFKEAITESSESDSISLMMVSSMISSCTVSQNPLPADSPHVQFLQTEASVLSMDP
jgi:hypothetical protein